MIELVLAEFPLGTCPRHRTKYWKLSFATRRRWWEDKVIFRGVLHLGPGHAQERRLKILSLHWWKTMSPVILVSPVTMMLVGSKSWETWNARRCIESFDYYSWFSFPFCFVCKSPTVCRGYLGTLEIKMSVNQAADSAYVVGITDEWLPGAVFYWEQTEVCLRGPESAILKMRSN